MVRRLVKFCLKGSKRRRFASVRDKEQPDVGKIYPWADVSTRWNSTYDAIARAVKLKKTIIAYTSTIQNKKCPRFTLETFKALEQILPTLEIFLKLTKRYSTRGVTIHKVLNDMHNTIEAMKKAKKSAHPAGRPSFQGAIDKLMKYMQPMLKNDWLCAAFAPIFPTPSSSLSVLLIRDAQQKNGHLPPATCRVEPVKPLLHLFK